MPEQHKVGLQGREVDLDLIDVRVTGLHLPDAWMSDEQIGLVGAAGFIGLFQSVERCLHAEHLRYGVDHDAPAWGTQLKTLIGEPMREVHLRERVGQGAVRAASSRQAGSVMVAAYHDCGDTVLPDRGQGALGDPERAVVRGGVVEDVAQPNNEIGLLRQR